MALGRGGIRTVKQFDDLRGSKQAKYEQELEASELLLTRVAANPREALRQVLGRTPSGSDYKDFYDLAGRNRQDWQRLFRGDAGPIITADGVFDLAPGATWNARSLSGKQWSLVANEKRMSDAELARALGRLDREVRVIGDDGRLIRVRPEANVASFRSFARSDEAKQERVISPRMFSGGGR